MGSSLKSGNIVSIENARAILANINKVIYKPSLDSSGGNGIMVYESDQFEDLLKRMQNDKNAIVQKIVKQSSCLANINDSSLNTIRISSLLNTDGSISINAAILRSGTKGNFVDNVCSGGIFCSIDISSGNLTKYGYRRTNEKYEKIEVHPSSNLQFENYHIEGFEKIIDLVKKNAKYFPRTRLLGWDFSLDENNEPILIEVNLADHEIEMMQVANGPLFCDNLVAILNEVFNVKA